MEIDEFNVMEYLSKDVPLHIDMLECLRRKNARIIAAQQGGALIYNKSGGILLLSAADIATAKRFLDAAEGEGILTAGSKRLGVARSCGEWKQNAAIVAHQPCYVSYLMERYTFENAHYCHQFCYLENKPFAMPENGPKMAPLDAGYIDFVMENYDNARNRVYLLERLNSNNIFGAFMPEGLAGFVGMHDDGSMGMLEVLPAYRRRGIGQYMEYFMLNRALSMGEVPYAQILEGNAASLGLQCKTGVTVSDKRICWVY